MSLTFFRFFALHINSLYSAQDARVAACALIVVCVREEVSAEKSIQYYSPSLLAGVTRIRTRSRDFIFASPTQPSLVNKFRHATHLIQPCNSLFRLFKQFELLQV